MTFTPLSRDDRESAFWELKAIRSDRGSLASGERISHIFLGLSFHITLTSTGSSTSLSVLNFHHASHVTVGCRRQGCHRQKSAPEFIPGCHEEQTDRCRDGSRDILLVRNSSQAVSSESTRVFVLIATLLQDFRSQDGLYNLVKQKHPDAVLKGRDLFDASLFRNPVSTSVFYSFIAGLKQAVDDASPSPTHRFIKALDAKGRLLRSYTQNIDGLEERAGLLGSSSQEAKAPSPSKAKGKARAKLKIKEIRNVQLHGDIHRVRCTVCSADYPCSMSYLEMFSQGFPPDCPDCTTRCEWPDGVCIPLADSGSPAQARVARSARALRVGTLRPAIVLYDEPHPLGDEIGQIQAADARKGPDLVIIMGTSLKVHGLKKLVKEFAKVTHARKGPKTPGIVIFVNKTPPGSEWDGVIDYHVEGDTDSWTEKVIADWKKHKPADWEHQTTLVEGVSPFRISNGVFGGRFFVTFFVTFP